MRKIVVSISVAIGAVLLVTGAILVKRSDAVTLPLKANGIPQHGLTIVTFGQRDFERLRNNLPHDVIQSETSLQPYVFVQNLANKRVIAYALRWDLLKDDGTVATKIRRYSREDLLIGSEASDDRGDNIVLRPHTARLFSLSGYADKQEVSTTASMVSELSDASSAAVEGISKTGLLQKTINEVSHTVSITVSLDGAIFEDGTFVGPNTTNFFERIAAKNKAREDTINEILNRLDQHVSSTEILSDLKTRSQGLHSLDVVTPPPDARSEDLYNFYSRRFLDDLLTMRNGIQDDDLTLRRMLAHNKPRHNVRLQKLP